MANNRALAQWLIPSRFPRFTNAIPAETTPKVTATRAPPTLIANRLEKALAHLEGGTVAAAFSSGSAATNAVLQSLSPGDHVLCTDGFYGTEEAVARNLQGMGARPPPFSTLRRRQRAGCDAARNDASSGSKRRRNPMMRVTDIRRICDIARQAGVTSIVDNTVASPVLQRPLDLGADMVMHSTTKYLGGHSDILGGAIIARAKTPLFERIHQLQAAAGRRAVTFRMLAADARHSNAGVTRCVRRHRMPIVSPEFLEQHPQVESVLYAGLTSHPNHDIAVQQMHGGFGGLTFVPRKGLRQGSARHDVAPQADHSRDQSRRRRNHHRPSLLGRSLRARPTPKNLLRLSVGIEHYEDLIEDLDQALSKDRVTRARSRKGVTPQEDPKPS